MSINEIKNVKHCGTFFIDIKRMSQCSKYQQSGAESPVSSERVNADTGKQHIEYFPL